MSINSIEELFKELDKSSPEGIAKSWAIAAASPDISREIRKNCMLVLQMYTNKQDGERKNRIEQRFEYLTSPRGALELSKLI